MKVSRDIKLSRANDSISLDIPSCGRAYVPKINFRRPGNLILGLFLIFLILLFGGLAFASDQHHHYGSVQLVVNVGTLKTNELRDLTSNQMVIPSKPIPEFTVQMRTQNTLLDEEPTQIPNRHQNSIDTDRNRRDPPIRSVQPMVDYKRSALPIDQARELLKTVPMDWPVNMPESEILNDWSKKHELMTNEQNLQIAHFLVEHFASRAVVKRSTDDVMVVSFYIMKTSRSKRDADSCKELKNKKLWENLQLHKSAIVGHHFFSIEDLCVYGSYCKEGFCSPVGCDLEHNGTEISLEYYYSDEQMKTRQDLIPASDIRGFCEFDGIVLNRCEGTYDSHQKTLFYKVLGRSGFLTGPHSITISPLYSELSDFNCSGVASSKCKGDDTFKALFTESGSDETCFCKGNSTKHMINVKIGATNYRLDAAHYEHVPVKIRKEKPEELLCTNCDVTCNHGQITIDYDTEVEMLELCSGRFCMDLKPQKHFTVPLSLAALDHSYTYYVKFIDGKEKDGIIQCKIDELCPLIDCHLCIEKMKNPHCYNALDKINFIIILATWFILLAIIVKVLKIILFGCRIIKAILIGLFKASKSVMKIVLKPFGLKLVTERIITTRTLEDGPEETRVARSEHVRTSIRRPIPTFVKSLVFLGLIALSSACSETITMDTNQLDCRMVNKDLQCSTRTTAHISVAPVGQLSCFIFKTADGQAAGTLTVKTLSLDLLCNKEVLYWTYPVVPTFDQICYCSGSSSGKGNEEECNKYNKDYKCGKPLKCDPSAVYSHCKTATGGWGEGCFSYSDKYCYYSIAMKNPTKKVYEVSVCNSFYWQVNLEVVIQTINGEEVVKSKLNPGSQVSFTGGNVRLEGASIPPMPILSKCFIKTSEITYIAECVKGTGISAGVVGEVQCKSAKDALKPTLNGCSHSPHIHNVIVQGGSLSYNYRILGLNTLRNRLPISSGGFTIKEKGGDISASLNYMSMISLKLSLSGLTMVPYSIMSKCSIKLVDLKGCVSCLTGAVLRLRTKTDEGHAKAILSCPSLKADIPFRVGNREEIQVLNAHFQNGLIKESCKITCPGGVIDLKIEANLVSDVQVTRLFEDDLSDVTEVVTNWFSGMFGQFNNYLLVPAIAVLILGSLIIIKFMIGIAQPSSHQKSW